MKLFSDFLLELRSHLMAADLELRLNLNPFLWSLKRFCAYKVTRDPQNSSFALQVNFEVCGFAFSYIDPRDLRHQLEHTRYARRYREAEEFGLGASHYEAYEPKCDHFAKDMGYEEGLGGSNDLPHPMSFSSLEDVEEAVKAGTLPSDKADMVRNLIMGLGLPRTKAEAEERQKSKKA